MYNEIINTKEKYNYNKMKLDIEKLKMHYPFIKVDNIGESVRKRSLPCIRLGEGKNEVLYSASIHANEWITSLVLMKFVEDYCKAYINNMDIFDYNVREIFKTSSIYIIPMLNPDGIELVTGEIKEGTYEYEHYKNIANSFPNITFPEGWKANYNGVDLNLQFPADWETAKKIKYEQGFTKPAPRDFVGFGPLTEPEALAIYNFTLIHDFRLILAYHTQGEVIYWKYKDFIPKEAEEIGKIFSKTSGYILQDTPYESGSAGYKDWFIKQHNRPGYTIEAGLGVNPLPLSQFDKIYRDNIGILTLGAMV